MIASLIYNERVRNWTAQFLLLAGSVTLLAWLYGNTVTNLANRGIRVGFEFLWRSAGFPISESVLNYTPSDTFFWAYVVGLANTVFISVIAIVLASVLGLIVGLARRSAHPLTSGLAGIYITAIRNTPLIVQLLFWYALATTSLPAPRNAISPFGGVYLSLRGFYIPRFQLEGGLAFFLSCLIGFIGITLLVHALRRHLPSNRSFSFGYATALVIFSVAAWQIIGVNHSVSVPELKGFNFVGGTRLSPEFAALMIGLVIYTSAFIGEIIRGGIDAVGKGQWEAGRAIGLKDRQTLFLIIVPQALRIIIPPLTTQYVSTVKNSTLALAVGYPELGLVVGTVINQTGQAIESILIMLSVYLTVSVSVSLLMNWSNAKVALVQR